MSRSRQRLRAIALGGRPGARGVRRGPADNAGGSATPGTLRLGTPISEPARAASDNGERFAARVGRLPGGRIKIRIAWEAGPGRAAP